MISLLKHRNFKLFFLAEIISAFGVGISTVGANWYLIDKTNDARLLGVMLSLNVLAGFLASPIIGGLADKYNRRNIILVTYITQVILYMAIVGTLLILGYQTYLIIAFAVVNGISWTTYLATSRSLVKQILNPREYADANSLLEVSLQTGMFIAGGFSGLLYQWNGFDLIITVTIIMFLISIVILFKMNVGKPQFYEEENKGLINEYLSGWKFLKDNKIIFVFGIISIIPMIFTMIFNVTLPGYIYNVLNLTSVEFGFSDMLYGIGGLAAGLFSSVVIRRISTKLMIFILYIVLIVNSAIFGGLDSTFYLFLGSFLLGYSISSIRIYMNTAIMNSVSEKFVGRAFTIWTSLSLLVQSMVSPLIGIWINITTDKIGFYIIFAASIVILVILPILSKSNQIIYNYKEE